MAVALDFLGTLVGLDADARAGDDAFPNGKQGFLGAVGDVEAAVHGDFDRLGHQEFVAGILANRRGNLALLEYNITKFPLLRRKRGAQSGWPGSHNRYIKDFIGILAFVGGRPGFFFLQSGVDMIDCELSFVDGGLDQSHAAEFSGDK